jgi:spore maturation protein CgeE
MSLLLNNIYSMENEYVKLFSEAKEDEETISFNDLNIPDMYTHNFILYKNNNGLYDYIVNQLNHLQSKGFLRIVTHYKVEQDLINRLPVKPEVTIYDIYHKKSSEYEDIKANPDCKVIKANSSKLLDDGIRVDIKANQVDMGLDFATRRIHRKSKAYQDPNSTIDFYVCYCNDKPIGNIEYATANDVVKLEDFDILPNYQRKGFGSTVLKHLLQVAYNNHIEDVYLVTDQSDTAKEIGEKTEIMFRFNK